MLDQLLILAEGGSHASEGVSPFLVGGGAFVILLCLLGITYLFSGLNQKPSQRSKDVAARRDGEHGRTTSTRPGQH
ncbi:hypothetical protein ACT3TZ_00985 [Brachybacterium sp. AOP25-B2-12]|uniref:hypothetical protein n=1 Tax=Brachybacterium sp. AOP25-B2-12 TaxID=3457710 RepID=UPI004034109C